MLRQVNPNAWSCLPTAFANTLDLDLNAVLGLIGHDGSEITHAGLPEPLNRRGFHPQELIKLCLKGGFYVTRVELYPNAVATFKVPHTPKLYDIGGMDWFKENLYNSYGVLECRTTAGVGHAMSYEGNGSNALVVDPAGGREDIVIELDYLEQYDRYVYALWRIDD